MATLAEIHRHLSELPYGAEVARRLNLPPRKVQYLARRVFRLKLEGHRLNRDRRHGRQKPSKNPRAVYMRNLRRRRRLEQSPCFQSKAA
jgi:hypothetical protein